MSTPVVHVIMPVGSDPRHRAKQEAIRRGIEAAGFRPEFPAYSMDNPHFEPAPFATKLRGADAVLADLTGERPSCYFEIGFAQALGRPVYLIAEKGTDIHQTAFRDRARFYANLDELQRVVRASVSRDAGPEATAAE
jgi:nucleoside 2-deoxyribosyltransferase